MSRAIFYIFLYFIKSIIHLEDLYIKYVYRTHVIYTYGHRN